MSNPNIIQQNISDLISTMLYDLTTKTNEGNFVARGEFCADGWLEASCYHISLDGSFFEPAEMTIYAHTKARTLARNLRAQGVEVRIIVERGQVESATVEFVKDGELEKIDV